MKLHKSEEQQKKNTFSYPEYIKDKIHQTPEEKRWAVNSILLHGFVGEPEMIKIKYAIKITSQRDIIQNE